MSAKQDRQGVRTAADIERKYNLRWKESFAEIASVSKDTRQSVDRVESELRSDMEVQASSITRETERIIMAALESYVETDDLDSLRQTVNSELSVMAEKISTNYEATTTQVTDINGDLQAVMEKLQKHFGFSEDGSSIGLLKAAERPNAIDVGGDVYMNGNSIYGTLGMFDTRNTDETPEWYMKNYGCGTVWEVKTLAAIGFAAPSETIGPMETIIPWNDASGGLLRQKVYEGRTCWKRIATSDDTWGEWESDVLLAYPIGSIYLAFNHVSPATLFGGTWERIYGAFPWFTDADGEIGLTGGERTVALTEEQIPPHNHGGTYTDAGTARTHAWLASGGSAMGYDTINTGGGEAHNNMPPYIQISAWRRTA